MLMLSDPYTQLSLSLNKSILFIRNSIDRSNLETQGTKNETTSYASDASFPNDFHQMARLCASYLLHHHFSQQRTTSHVLMDRTEVMMILSVHL